MKHYGKTILLVLLMAACALIIAGCEKQTKYEILTFFFTGVPPIDGERREVDGEVNVDRKPKQKRPAPQVFIHGPKAAGECFYCHDTDSTLSFQRVKKGGGMPRLGDITPGRLTMPFKDLCIQCHTSKSSELRFTEDLWVHGPLSDGQCTACHDYHQTKYQYMLLSESSIELCSRCHAKGYIMQTEEHKSEEECISCHNPHVGANRLLLRKDFDEVF